MLKNKKILRNTKPINLFDKIVIALNCVIAAVLLLSYLAPFTDPRQFSIIALLGFSYQFLLVGNILFIIYWAIRSKIYVLISIVCILSGFSIIKKNFGFRFKNDKGKSKEIPNKIRIMAYNVHSFKGIEENENVSITAEVRQILCEQHPDIVNIEEFYERKKDSATLVQSFKKKLNTNYFCFIPNKLNRWEGAGNAIFSKYPIIDTGSIAGPDLLKIKAIFADVKDGNKIFRVYCIHLAAVDIKEGDKKKYLSGKLSINSSKFIEGRLNSAFALRSYQVYLIKKHLEKCPYPYILAGDFNDTPISYAVNTLSSGLKNTFIEKGSGFGITYFSKFPKLHIDYILVSPQFDVLNYETIDKKLSDHKPIVSDLWLK